MSKEVSLSEYVFKNQAYRVGTYVELPTTLFP